ncbi:MAG TPA: hypothetical protein VFR78_03925 [Pyrinomonadaceae bacterium]|nr:hypothetical protein [Pyrinomonadaceae bacterium]
MRAVEKRASSWLVSAITSIDGDPRNRIRVVAVVIGTLVTIVMWVVHWRYPHLFQRLLHARTEIKLLSVLVLAPPFAAAFSIGHLINPQARETVDHEAGPMSGYFYRRSADKKWTIGIAAGIVAATNFLLMFITAQSK